MIQIKRDVDLSHLNTMRLKSTAEALVEIHERSQLLDICEQLPKYDKWQVLGGGSNLILAPRITGLTVLMRTTGRQVQAKGNEIIVEAEAGEIWHEFVQWTLQQGFWGLENLALIPGTLGASPIQNIGAYGVEMREFCRHVTVLDVAKKEFKKISAAECGFAYRDSKFKSEWKQKYLIASVEFAFPVSWKARISYPELQREIQAQGKSEATVTAQEIFNIVVDIRKRKLPDPKVLGNVGSFFKNPIVSKKAAEQLMQQFPGIPCYPAAGDDLRKLSAAWLIEKCGLKGLSRGGMQVSTQHSLVLINQERATLQDVAELTQAIQSEVRSQFHVELETEPQFWMS